MILVVANLKGGVGKTTLATSILAELAKDNAVIGVDLDAANETASGLWSSHRTEEQGRFYPLVGEIKPALLQSKADYDHTVVDGGGYDSAELRMAMLVADVILIPLKVGANSNIDSFRKTSEIIEQVIELRDKDLGAVKVIGVVTAAPHIGSNAEVDRAIQEIVADPLVEPVSVILGDRSWYGRAFDAYLGLTEYESPNPRDRKYVEKAQNEFLDLMKEIFGERK
jgi:chromosome partitioning protein